jgi:alpha-D-xyloside xylohydrolase
MTRTRIFFFALFSIFICSTSKANVPAGFVVVSDGVIVYTNPQFTGNSNAVKLQVIAPNIVRVIAAYGKEFVPVKSLMTIYETDSKPVWNVVSTKEKVTLKTRALTAIININTGAVSFFDSTGKKILSEKQTLGRSLSPAVFEGQRLYNIIQTFETTPDDAYYGLGQHQDDVYNYKGEQVSLFQNNTEVAIPFLISKKNYGILWDNYSLTKVGDIRAYRPLSDLKLFSRQDEQGWLTATYSNDKSEPVDVAVERAESSINMEFLGESKLFLPEAFKPATGIVTWEGSIASEFAGTHKFKFVYGGYINVWIDGKQVLSHWRKAWNPAPALLEIEMKAGQKIPVKIEWIPEGSESYLSLKWLEPTAAADQNHFSFSSEAGKQLDYYFIAGKNMDEVIAGYRMLTGKAPIVPRWALGFWQSRERYKTKEEILSTVAEFRKRKIPIDNIVLDWSYWKEAEWGSQDFDETRFSNPDSMIRVLHDKFNTKLMISVWPKFYEGIATYKEFERNGWLYKRNIADRQKDWIGKGYISTFYDAFNENARKGFWDLINKKIWSKGVDAWWMDASEPDILSNVSPEKRKQQMVGTVLGPAAEYLNAYPLQNAKGIYEGQRSTDSGKRVFLLTRSGYAGSQRYAATIWSGDIGSRWHDMKAQISAGINFSMSGLPYWTMDIGGFVVESRFESPNEKDLEEWRELMTRWYQFGAFVPIFRVHGQFPFREIYNIAPENHPAYKSMLYYNQLRYRLMPYIYSIAGKTYHNDYTIMRGLVMDFPTDKNVVNIGDQYMFGPSLMINPVYDYRSTNRKVYLPASSGWYDLYTGKYFQGGKTIDTHAPYERIPLFIKEGSIIPTGPEMQYTSQRPADTITLHVYTGQNAEFTLYEDEDINYNYEKGAHSSIRVIYNEATKTLTIGDRIGSFPGMLKQRVFRIIKVSPDQPRPFEEHDKIDKEILYNGKSVSQKM